MKQPELNVISGTMADVSNHWRQTNASLWEGHVVYRELADFPVQMVDPLEELARSVSQLEDMQARMRFMVREIRQMMKV